jgi:hypothetical protein
MVLMCTTSPHDAFTGAAGVFNTSTRLNGNRTGEYKCSDSMRSALCSFDQG